MGEGGYVYINIKWINVEKVHVSRKTSAYFFDLTVIMLDHWRNFTLRTRTKPRSSATM